MIIRKNGDDFIVKIYKENILDFNLFDIDCIKDIFQKIFSKIKEKYEINGLIDVDVYVNWDYGMIIELHPVNFYNSCDDVDIKIHIHLDCVFLIEVNINDILDYEDIYYYKDKFYGTFLKICDNEVFYKDTEKIINEGIKIF